MSWNIAAECVSLGTLVIVWAYSKGESNLPTLKNSLFQGCFLVTFCAMVLNISATLLLSYYMIVPLWFTWFVNTMYFLITPLMGFVYYLYTISILYDKKTAIRKLVIVGLVPAIGYVMLVLINPLTKAVFDIDYSVGYSRGPWIQSTYIIFYFYCVGILVLTIMKKKATDRHIYYILLAFPVFAVVVTVVQLIYPTVILSGSAATSALLIIYLYLQNKEVTVDFLTGVPNRQEFSDKLEFTMKKNPLQPLTLMVISLREFRQINNTCGQQNGDTILRSICAYIKSVAPKGSTYKFGGDEFAILFGNLEYASVPDVIEKVKSRMKEPWIVNGYSFNIRVAIGVVTYPDMAGSRETLIHTIEYAVMTAKKSDRTVTVCYCTPTMVEQLQRRKVILNILKERVPRGDFEMYYQPIFCVKTGKFSYAESLMRIKDKKLGFISPGEFIPIVEESGLMVEMTYQVLHKVCAFVRDMSKTEVSLHAVHVNFSALQFEESDLEDKVMDIVKQYDIPFSSIKIEITESAVAEKPESIIEFLKHMQYMNIKLGLDDFGIGYSNVATVMSIPFDTIKLDKSLLGTWIDMQKMAVTLKNLIRTFKDLGMTVIAEGVETEEQKEFIVGCGVDQIQGYYYAKPMPKDEIVQFLIEKKNINKRQQL